jgi:hypothetical protein
VIDTTNLISPTVTYIAEAKMFVCDSCGAYASDERAIMHDATCNPMDTRKFIEVIEEANRLEDEGIGIELKELRLIFAGKAIFTIRSKKTGNRFTFRFKRAKETDRFPNPVFFVSVLSGPNNIDDYEYIGSISANGKSFRPRKNYPTDERHTTIKQLLFWLLNKMNDIAYTDIKAQAELFHAGYCMRCGRILTVPESIISGLGPECKKLKP